MRKFIALGISAITAGSILLTAGGPAAHAAETTTTTTVPKTIVDDVCTAVPDVAKSVTDAIAAINVEADVATYNTKKTAAQAASSSFVSALVNYLKDTANKSSDLPISTSTLSVRQGQYGDALAAWSQAAVTRSNHFGQLEFLGVQNAALAQLGEGLGCTPPPAV